MLQDFEICHLASSKDYELTYLVVIFEHSMRLFAIIQGSEYSCTEHFGFIRSSGFEVKRLQR